MGRQGSGVDGVADNVSSVNVWYLRIDLRSTHTNNTYPLSNGRAEINSILDVKYYSYVTSDYSRRKCALFDCVFSREGLEN
jgi:hypothetical protein